MHFETNGQAAAIFIHADNRTQKPPLPQLLITASKKQPPDQLCLSVIKYFTQVDKMIRSSLFFRGTSVAFHAEILSFSCSCYRDTRDTDIKYYRIRVELLDNKDIRHVKCSTVISALEILCVLSCRNFLEFSLLHGVANKQTNKTNKQEVSK